MFASIRRHQKWLWAVISALTIISFVAFFSPAQQTGARVSAGASEVIGTLYGRPVTRDAYGDAMNEARLRFFINYRQWPEDNQMARQMGLLERETKTRLVQLAKVKEQGIYVGEEAVAAWIAELFQDREQKVFRKDAYDQFITQGLPSRRLSGQDFERFARNELAIQHLSNLAGVGGLLITPKAAEANYRSDLEELDTRVAFVATSNYLAKVTLDPNELATFYTNQQANYRIPEKLVIQYVRFPGSNHIAAAEARLLQNTNLTQEIAQIYEQRGADYYRGDNGQPLGADEAKARIRAEFVQRLSVIEAQKLANAFAEVLLETTPVSADNLAKVAAAQGHTVEVSLPFGQFEEPFGLGLRPGFARTAFQLSAEEPFLGEPVVGENAVYVVGLKDRVASILPPLDQVRERVTEDFRRNRSVALATAAGLELQRTISTNLTQGKTFDELALAAGAEVVDLSPFSQKTMSMAELGSRVDLNSIKSVAANLSPGGISAFTTSRDGGFIVYLEKRIPADESKVQAALPDHLKTQRQGAQFEAFQKWVEKELELANSDLPGDRKPTTP